MSIGVGATSVGSNTGGTTVTTAAVSSAASGSAFVLGYSFRNTSTFSSVADNKGNSAGYTRIGTELDTGFAKVGLFYVEGATGGSGHTATLTIVGSSEMTLFFLEITGGALTGIFDKQNHQFDTSSPFTSLPTATTSQANELLLAMLMAGTANPIIPVISGATPSAGWTIQTGAEELDGNTKFSGCFATNIVSATGAYEAGFTEVSSTDGAVWIATFKELTAGAGVSPPQIGKTLYVLP